MSSEKGNLVAVGKKIAQVILEGRDVRLRRERRPGRGRRRRRVGHALQRRRHHDRQSRIAEDDEERRRIDADRSIKFAEGNDPGITLTSGSTVMAHTKKGHDVKSNEVKFHAKDNDVRIGGKKILIDA